MAELQVEIVAADHFVWAGPAKLVKARSVDGEIGVLPGHVPTLTVLAAGDLEIDPVSEARFSVRIDGDSSPSTTTGWLSSPTTQWLTQRRRH